MEEAVDIEKLSYNEGKIISIVPHDQKALRVLNQMK